MRVDTLTIDAVVTDSFSETLGDLARNLKDVAGSQRLVDEQMDIDVNVDGLRDLKSLRNNLVAIEALDLASLNTTLDSLDSLTIGGASATADGGGVATPDGGGEGGGGGGPFENISREGMLRTARRLFGDAFDEKALANRPERIRGITDVIEGDLSEYIDEVALADAVIEGDLELDTVENLTARGEDSIDAFLEIDRRGLTDLPTRRRRLIRPISSRADNVISSTLEAFENFDATTLNNLRASLIPLLGVLVGALPAAIAGIVGLAGAAVAAAGTLGAVGALGALGVALADGQSLQDVAEDIRTSFIEAFEPIAEALQPTFLEAIDSVELFISRLGRRASVLRNFSDELLAAVDAVEQFTIGGLSNMMRFAAVAEDALVSMTAPFEGMSITRGLAGVLSETLPLIRLLTTTIINALPAIIGISRGFLLFAGSLITVTSAFLQLIDIVPFGAELFGAFLSVLLITITALSLAAAATNIWAAALTQRAITALVAKISTLKIYITTLYQQIAATWSATAATLAFATAAAVAISVITLGIGAVTSLAGSFAVLGGNINNATKSLRRFSRQNGQLGETAIGGSTLGDGRRSGFVDVTDNSRTVIRAPDAETGTQVARSHEYRQSKLVQPTS